ncbi:MFS transporter [Ornithinicoccus halotolerans]|uniref:MFS transporter n=1 Tax=Ornithinicoccus halotolerans TaxID=1748220 RepID=UPI001E2C1FAC|nr:MFS transporter [Ornithinicoccus halotolerans]
MTSAGFSGYAALLPVAPLWVVHGGAGSAGAGAVNGVLMLFTVLTQLFVPGALRRYGWAPVLVAAMVLLGVPALLHLVSDQLGWTLLLSAVRGLGFGILTVTGSAAVAELVDPARRGRAIGVYGLAVAGPQLLLLPAAPWVAEQLGFWVVFAISTAPLLGVVPAFALARTLTALPADHHHDAPTGAAPPGGGRSRRRTYLALLRPMALLLGVTLAGGALITFVPQITSDPAVATGGLLLLTGTAALSRWRFGTLADRYGTWPFLWPLVVLTAAGMALTAWAVTDAEATTVTLLLLGMAAVGISYGGLQNLTLVLAFAAVRRRDYGLASAVWNVGFDTGTGLGAVLVGALAAGYSFPVALLAAAGFSVATLPLALAREGGTRPRARPAAEGRGEYAEREP